MPDTIIKNEVLLFIRDLVSNDGQIINESANSFTLKLNDQNVNFESQLALDNILSRIFIDDTSNTLNIKGYFNAFNKAIESEDIDFDLQSSLKIANQFYNGNDLLEAVVIKDLKDAFSSRSGFEYKFVELIRLSDCFHLKYIIGGYAITIALRATDLMYHLEADVENVVANDVRKKVLDDTALIQNHLNNIYPR